MDVLKREYIKWKVQIPNTNQCYSRPSGPRYAFNIIPADAGTGTGAGDPRASYDDGSSSGSANSGAYSIKGGLWGGIGIAFVVAMWSVVTTCAINRDFIDLNTPAWLCNPKYYSWEWGGKGEAVEFNKTPHPRYEVAEANRPANAKGTI